MGKLKHVLRLSGTIFAFYITINFYIFMFTAMFTNNVTVVYWNHFQEASIEYIVYLLLLPVIIYATVAQVRLHKKLMKNKQAKELLYEK